MLRLLLIGATLTVRPVSAQISEVTYRVRFDATWSAFLHPDQFPANAHFSDFIGAPHSDWIGLLGAYCHLSR
jgi:hypothetical protein